MPLQVLVTFPPQALPVAGLPYVFRTTQRAAELDPSKVVWAGAPESFAQAWSRQLASFENFPLVLANGESPSRHLVPGQPLLVISAAGTPRPKALRTFLDKAGGKPARWIFEGKTVAVYLPCLVLTGKDVDELAEALLLLPGTNIAATSGDWHCAKQPRFVEEAETAIYTSLGKENDGFIARFDRTISSAVSRFLLKTPATPNQITTASLLLGILGCSLIATGWYRWQIAGALLLWSCCILDGCDGEVARLKLLCSKSGAAYDTSADNVAHLATFVGIAVGVYRARPDLPLFWPGIVLVSGVAACMFSVWWLILRRPYDKRSTLELFVERVASRDYVYLVVALILVGKLHWFLWSAAVGSHLFNAGLWYSASKAPRTGGPRLPPLGMRPS